MKVCSRVNNKKVVFLCLSAQKLVQNFDRRYIHSQLLFWLRGETSCRCVFLSLQYAFFASCKYFFLDANFYLLPRRLKLVFIRNRLKKWFTTVRRITRRKTIDSLCGKKINWKILLIKLLFSYFCRFVKQLELKTLICRNVMFGFNLAPHGDFTTRLENEAEIK